MMTNKHNYKDIPFVLDKPNEQWTIDMPIAKWIIVQYPETDKSRTVKMHDGTSKELWYPDETVDVDAYHEVEAKIVAIGMSAFDRADGSHTPVARQWLPLVNDIVRVPEYGNVNWRLGVKPDLTRFGAFDPAQIIAIVKPIKDRPDWKEYDEKYRFGRRWK